MIVNQKNNKLHLVLIRRIIAATCLIIFSLSIYVFLSEKQRISDVIVDRTEQGVAHLNAYLQPLLTANPLDKAAIKNAIDEFSKRSLMQRNGHYVYFQLLDTSGDSIALIFDEEYSLFTEMKKLAAGTKLTPNSFQDKNVQLISIQDKPHVRIFIPLNEDNKASQVFYADMVFAISDERISGVYDSIFKTILFISGIVLVTVLILYPVIFNLMKRLSQLSLNLLEANIDTLNVLGSAIAKRDSDTDAHNYRVTIMSVRLAENIGLPNSDIRCLIKGAFLHDVGKIGISDNILLKPGKLTESEFEIMRTHVEHGLDIIRGSKWLKEAEAVTGSHHEKYSGEGYPLGYSGDEIPVVARVFAIIDVFDALLSKRPYKNPIPYPEVAKKMEEGRGTHFDPVMLDHFFTISEQLSSNLSNLDAIELKEELYQVIQKYFLNDIADMI